jgi:hypothetical protein
MSPIIQADASAIATICESALFQSSNVRPFGAFRPSLCAATSPNLKMLRCCCWAGIVMWR